MTTQATVWKQVGAQFEILGQHLRSHFDGVDADAKAERAAFEKSMRGLLNALEDGFDAAGKAVRDPMLREDVTTVANSVRDALLASFETAGDQVRERLARPSARTAPPAKRSAPRRRTATPKK